MSKQTLRIEIETNAKDTSVGVEVFFTPALAENAEEYIQLTLEVQRGQSIAKQITAHISDFFDANSGDENES